MDPQTMEGAPAGRGRVILTARAFFGLPTRGLAALFAEKLCSPARRPAASPFYLRKSYAFPIGASSMAAMPPLGGGAAGLVGRNGKAQLFRK